MISARQILKDDKLVYEKALTTSSSEEVVGSYTYVFPRDKGGQPNRLIVTYKYAPVEIHDNYGSPNYKKATSTKEIYHWNGIKLNKIK